MSKTSGNGSVVPEYIIRIRRKGIGDLYYCSQSPLRLTDELKEADLMMEAHAHAMLDHLQLLHGDFAMAGRVITYGMALNQSKKNFHLQLN